MTVNYFPFHIGDFLGGIMHMDGTEIGAYTMLIVAHYQLGIQGLPNDDKKLAQIARVPLKTWMRIKCTVLEKFYLENSFWKNSKAVEVLQEIQTKSSDAKAKSLKRWNTDDATALPQQCHGNAIQKPITKEESKSPPKPPQGDGVSVPDWVPAEPWRKFKTHRGKKFTANAQQLAIDKLDRWRQHGHDPAEILNNSTMNGWKGLFEPKEKTNENLSRKPTKAERLKAAGDAAIAEMFPAEPSGCAAIAGPANPELRDFQRLRQGTGGPTLDSARLFAGPSPVPD